METKSHEHLETLKRLKVQTERTQFQTLFCTWDAMTDQSRYEYKRPGMGMGGPSNIAILVDILGFQVILFLLTPKIDDVHLCCVNFLPCDNKEFCSTKPNPVWPIPNRWECPAMTQKHHPASPCEEECSLPQEQHWACWSGDQGLQIRKFLLILEILKKKTFTGFPRCLNYLFYVTVYAIWYMFSGLQLHCQVTISCKSLTLWHKLVCNHSISMNNSESMFCIDIN